jgi:hypothetical protein
MSCRRECLCRTVRISILRDVSPTVEFKLWSPSVIVPVAKRTADVTPHDVLTKSVP